MESYEMLMCLLVLPIWTYSAGASTTSASCNQLETFVNETYGPVYHMELDLYKNDGSVLFTAFASLRTTEGPGSSVSVVTTESWSVTGFTQLNSTHLVLTETSKNCIKMVNREDGQQRTLAGTCDTSGFQDGGVGIGRLFYPRSIEKDLGNSSRVLITDRFNNAIRYVDVSTGELGTISKSGFHYPDGMLWIDEKLLVSNQHYISEVYWLNSLAAINNIIVGTPNTTGEVYGSFSDSRFSNPSKFVNVGDNHYLLSDSNNFKLRLLNVNTSTTGPVCTEGELICLEGSVLPSKPLSLLNVGNDVLIGTESGIYRLSGIVITDSLGCRHDNITKYLKPGELTVEVELYCGNYVIFPEGVHAVRGRHDPETCRYYVHVLTSPIIRTPVFTSEFNTSCDVLTEENANNVFLTILKSEKEEFQAICQNDCVMSSTKDPWYTCENDLLTAYWPMQESFSVDITAPPSALVAILEERLIQETCLMTEIPIFSHQPPLVKAMANSDGESVQISLSSSCANETLTYNVGQDVCI